MRAAILNQLNSPLLIEEVELTPLKLGQVLVEVLLSGLCGAQIQEISGYKGNEKFLPHLMGHEGVGIVREIGLGVTQVAVGDKVVMHWRPNAKGIESEFPKYIFRGREITSGKVTTFSEFAIVSENRLSKVPATTDNRFAALLGCSISTAFGVLEQDAELKYGESVLVLGVGGVGLAILMAARFFGASQVMALDREEQKSIAALNSGADAFTNSFQDIEKAFDVVVDTTGNSDVIDMGFSKLRSSGRMILVGQPKPNQSITFQNGISFFEGLGKRLIASQGGGFMPDRDIPRLISLQKKGLIPFENLITHSFTLENINNAIQVVSSGAAGRIVIETR